MSKKYGTLTSELLKAIGESTGLFNWPPEYSESWQLEQIYGSRKKFQNAVSYLKHSGHIKVTQKKGKKFLSLTQKGELQMLVSKAGVEKKDKWDGKWRIIMFDIPVAANNKRNLLRSLLKRNHFIKLQASVFISPYELNREAIDYLKQSGLINFIRIIKVEELDEEKELKKRFKLK